MMGRPPAQQFAQFPYGLPGLFGGARLHLVTLRQLTAYDVGKRLNHLIRLAGNRMGFRVQAHRSCDLLLKATRGVTIALVSSRERKRRQPGLATDDPAFVGWHQLVRGIQGS